MSKTIWAHWEKWNPLRKPLGFELASLKREGISEKQRVMRANHYTKPGSTSERESW